MLHDSHQCTAMERDKNEGKQRDYRLKRKKTPQSEWERTKK